MSDNALYVYGIVKFGLDLDWKESGINGKNVYVISEGKFGALVHDCQERPYASKCPDKIKEWIIAHNEILEKAMRDFGGVIPLHFNTIIKNGEKTSKYNLKAWLANDKEILEKTWIRIEFKKEYGIRIYYEKEKLIQGVSSNKKIKEIERSYAGRGEGLTYLLQGKVKDNINEIAQSRINQFKKKFYNDIKKVSDGIKVNISRIFVNEEKDLLLSLSILVNKQQIIRIKYDLEKNIGKDFSFQLVGPFAPYSFVGNETRL